MQARTYAPDLYMCSYAKAECACCVCAEQIAREKKRMYIFLTIPRCIRSFKYCTCLYFSVYHHILPCLIVVSVPIIVSFNKSLERERTLTIRYFVRVYLGRLAHFFRLF
jgi:hypothetical protein